MSPKNKSSKQTEAEPEIDLEEEEQDEIQALRPGRRGGTAKLIIGIIVVLIVIGIVYYYGACRRGSGIMIGETQEVEGYSKVELSVPANLYLSQHQDKGFQYHIEAEDNILPLVDFKVDNKTLEIQADKCFRNHQPINIYVVSSEIEEITLQGSGDIIGETVIQGEELTIDLNGSGEINLEVDVDTLTTEISGSGQAEIQGRADRHLIDFQGSSDISGLDLKTKTTIVDLSGSGSADVYVIDELEVKISGSGEVRYKGDPQIVNQDISGSGTVEKLE